jgi:hypothetical protein
MATPPDNALTRRLLQSTGIPTFPQPSFGPTMRQKGPDPIFTINPSGGREWSGRRHTTTSPTPVPRDSQFLNCRIQSAHLPMQGGLGRVNAILQLSASGFRLPFYNPAGVRTVSLFVSSLARILLAAATTFSRIVPRPASHASGPVREAASRLEPNHEDSLSPPSFRLRYRYGGRKASCRSVAKHLRYVYQVVGIVAGSQEVRLARRSRIVTTAALS